MIARLVGELVEKTGGTLVVDVNGVGYEVNVSPSVSASLTCSGNKVNLVVYTDVRETAIVLYGFRSAVEKQTFLLLKKVKGIGSKIAMVILSSMSPEQLMIAIGQGDTSSLTKVPGIGKKSAERIILELREQVVEFVKDPDALSDAIEISRFGMGEGIISTIANDAALALQKLGFSKDVATKAVKEASFKNPDSGKDVGELLKQSLAYLG